MNSNAVRIHCYGHHPDQIRDKALSVASDFFQVPEDKLAVGLFTAEPVAYSVSGSPLGGFEADVVVWLT